MGNDFTSLGGLQICKQRSCTLKPLKPGSDTKPGPELPYPTLSPVAFFCMKQTTRPRSWCLWMVYTWFERVSILVILLNCATLGMFQPCAEMACHSQRCIVLQAFDDFIFSFFAAEMLVKMAAMGVFGKKCYLGDTWNRLDMFIILSGMLEYSLDMESVSLSAIRTVRVLRPLRAINRVPSMRILVTLLLDTLPMLGNVLLLLQLWSGLLRNRCFLDTNVSTLLNTSLLPPYYRTQAEAESPFICSLPQDNGMQRCGDVPPSQHAGLRCQAQPSGAAPFQPLARTMPFITARLNGTIGNSSCMDWNQLYTVCQASSVNPHNNAINFDNIGYAWIAIFQVITLEGWVDIMYFVMDAHSFYNFIYFILLIIIGSFFMINLCLVVIATQFSETKQREYQLMEEQRARQNSDSTLASYSEPGSCYEEIMRYLGHVVRKARARRKRARGRKLRGEKDRKQQQSGCGSRASIHHLVHYHHHHHHHHHYHINGGRQRVALHGPTTPCPHRFGHCCATPSQPTHCGPNPHSVHSVYHADCHLEGTRLAEGGLLGSFRGVAELMTYPTIVAAPPGSDSSGSPGRCSQDPGPSHLQLRKKSRQSLTSSADDEVLDAAVYGAEEMGQDHEDDEQDDEYWSEDEEEEDDGSENGEMEDAKGHHKRLQPCFHCWTTLSDHFRWIVESKYFNRGIMVAILFNSISMGIEYHEQPDELTNILEISNIVFTSMFALEMLLKILAFGLFGYIRNQYDIFDGSIVIISIWELSVQSGGGLSVLRTFRLLRVLKLVRFLPALRRQLVVLMRTMDNVATFCMLLMLFIFIFSILGMHLFGCKFSMKTESGDTLPDRKNFDSLLWAIVTVFQILTQEDWNVVLYHGMASTSPLAALYFIALMTFGNYVLFNLLVAILVEGFQAEVQIKSSMTINHCVYFQLNNAMFHSLLLLGYCSRVLRRLEPYKPKLCYTRRDWSLYIFAPQNKIRLQCRKIIAHKVFDHIVLLFIFLNCITIALERPDIEVNSLERMFLIISNYIFTAVFVAEMAIKVIALEFISGEGAYLRSNWNIVDGTLVFVSLVDIVVSMASHSGARILGILRVLRLLRTLRPLRVISRAPGLKLVVETLISSLKPIGNIVLICCAFFIIFGILGVQLFKGKFYHCDGMDIRNITNKSDCLQASYKWVKHKYNFDNLGQALMALFVLSSKDGWVNIMYTGLDAVAVDQQPIINYNPWMLLYFISFLLLVSFFVLNMFVGVVVENFHKCRQNQEEEEAQMREERRQRRIEKKRRRAQKKPYYIEYSHTRLLIHSVCTSNYLDLFITAVIGLNVITMAVEHYDQPTSLEEGLKFCNYAFTSVFVLEAVLKLVAFGIRRYFKDRWNQLDLAIVLLSIMGITLEEIEMKASLPINPTIIRIMRVLRITRGVCDYSDNMIIILWWCLYQVGNLGLLFLLLFFIYASLGVELFGGLSNSEYPCEGLSRHATFENFGMALLTLFRVSTGDNWNGIMKDTLRECSTLDRHCISYLPLISPIYFVTFVLTAQFVLVNVVVAVLMKHLEESSEEAREEEEEEAAAGRMSGAVAALGELSLSTCVPFGPAFTHSPGTILGSNARGQWPMGPASPRPGRKEVGEQTQSSSEQGQEVVHVEVCAFVQIKCITVIKQMKIVTSSAVFH
uniref:Voltage-dependent T-type calcium channel subunit alpha n=1 Tax=Eptatretus burgeri TaxID=7764 RepID=A0A8C4Q0X7_EPTBU